MLDPDDIAQTYIALLNQPRSAWTQELDIRLVNCRRTVQPTDSYTDQTSKSGKRGASFIYATPKCIIQ
jgi:hypothetical protein